MKIAYLTSEYPHEKTGNSGGIGTSIKNLAQALVKLGNDVTILVYGQNVDDFFWDDKIKVIRIKNIKLKGLSWYLTRKKIENLINILHGNKEIEIIEAPDWTGITSFIKTTCPLIIKLHGTDTYFCHLEKRPVKWVNKFHEKRALKKANAHISVSKFTANKTNEIFNFNINFKVIPNGINTDLFKPCKRQSGFSILYFGTMIRKKGAFELPFIFNEVIKAIPQAELIMVGQDASDIKTNTKSTYSLLEKCFSKLAIKQQKFVGKVPYTEVKNYIQNADVVVFPSFIEALPVTWLEAMAMQKVVVTSNIGWAEEIIQHGVNGFMCNPKSHKKYAETIIKVLQKEVDVKKVSLNARTTVMDKFSNLKVAHENIKFYKQSISN